MELWRPDLRSPAALLVPSVVARFCVGRRDPALSAEGLPLLPLCPDHRFRAVQIVIFVLSAGAGPLRERGCQGPATATYADGTREQITGRPISDPNFVSITDEQGYETGLYETGQQALHDSEQSALITGGILASVATGGLADGAIAGVGGGLVLRGLFAAGTGDLTFQGTQSGAHQLDPSLGEPDFSVPEFGLALALGATAPLVAGGITKLFGPSVAPEIVPATAEPLTFPETFEPPPPRPASIPEPPPAPVSVPPVTRAAGDGGTEDPLGTGGPTLTPPDHLGAGLSAQPTALTGTGAGGDLELGVGTGPTNSNAGAGEPAVVMETPPPPPPVVTETPLLVQTGRAEGGSENTGPAGNATSLQEQLDTKAPLSEFAPVASAPPPPRSAPNSEATGPTAAEIEAYVAGLPSKPTPTSSNSGLFEVEHTGSLNYRVSGGGTAIDVDGIEGSTLQDAKYVGSPSNSPYVDGSNVPDFLRQKVLAQQDYEIQRYQAVIGDPAVPFDSLDVLTNEPAAVPYFQRLLDSYGLPGQVRVVETNVPQIGPKAP